MSAGQCEMSRECSSPVTHIGDKGYLYCTADAIDRRASGYESTRKLRPWELRWIAEGRVLPSYKPGPEPKAVQA